MVTRHFYKEDEVVSALRWCMLKGRAKEAVFWCQELLDSELQQVVQKELYSLWVWIFGIGRLSILAFLANLATDHDILTFVYNVTQLPKGARDRSVLVLLLHGIQDEIQPDRISEFRCLDKLFLDLHCNELEKAFASATYQGKSRLAFDLSRPLWQDNPSRVYEILDGIQEIKHKGVLLETLTLLQFYEPIQKWETRACAIATICLDSKRAQRSLKPVSMSLPSEIQDLVLEWKHLLGRRYRRVYSIPHECLYYKTKRGFMSNKQSTLEELYRISSESLEGCPFWTRIIEEEVPWLDDDRKEIFYDIYFPDDIPDEWSKEDQAKSHGLGCLINKELPNYEKYIDRWFHDLPCQSYWCTNRDLQKLVKKEEPNWNSVFEKPWLPIVSTWCLTPVKKRVLILAV